jgi:hypothetical protein
MDVKAISISFHFFKASGELYRYRIKYKAITRVNVLFKILNFLKLCNAEKYRLKKIN